LLLLLVGLDGFKDGFGVVADGLEDLLFELGVEGGGENREWRNNYKKKENEDNS
jgi:hypothetical protein